VDPRPPDTDARDALEGGRAFVELDDHTTTLVSGPDARAWLHDLVTTDVETLEPHRTRTSLLLTPTGRIRALFHVLSLGEETFALVQRASQTEPLERLLGPYVLSSDVAIRAVSMRVLAVPGQDGADGARGAGEAWEPSVLGTGFDLVSLADGPTATEDPAAMLRAHGLEPTNADAVERRRIGRGQPRFGAELDTDSLPAEAGLDEAPVTDRGKGCFLGQEAVAKVANLGHPTRVVLAVSGDGPIGVREDVLAGDEEVGAVTSAAGSAGLVRVRWDARAERLRTRSGVALAGRPPRPEPV
jgi:tRNA-modifying protein YgfZ